MNAEVDQLEIRVASSATDAATGLDKLAGALERLRPAAKGGMGLGTTARQITQLNEAMSKLQVNKKGLGDLRSALDGLSGVKTNLTTVARQIQTVNSAMASLQVDPAKFQQLTAALNSLSAVQKATGLTSVVNSLGKIPKLSQDLAAIDWESFRRQIKSVADSLEPLAKQMDRIASGFSAFPAKIQRLIQSNAKLTASNKTTASSFTLIGSPVTSLIAKFTAYSYVTRRIVSFLADCVTSINEYVENVNLFQVAMGDYYDEAFAYAQLVSEKLGVDPSQWMRTQGVFQSIANGFGVAEEQAYALSKGLTELSYDLSSLYNEDMESSALRLQSALAGEIEPIRRLGISITEATLKEFALSKGIDKSVESMTEQEKALLRTLKLIEGASDIGAIWDFARTLESPANALRVLNQQITQLKRAIGSVLLPVLVQILPYVQAFVSILTDAISKLAVFVGFTMPEWDAEAWGSSAASGVSDVADAMDDAASSAESFKSATLGLDELNILSQDSGARSSGTGAGSDWAEGLEIPPLWDEKTLEEMSSQAEAIKSQLEDALAKITVVAAGFQLAIGLILVLTGANIPLGLKLMALGAAELATVAILNWDSMNASLQGVLTTITGMLAGFSLALGAILALSGFTAIGIPLMVLGAASLVSAVAINWGGGVSDNVQAAVTTISGIVGGSLLAVGAVLTFSGGNIPLGIALMAAGVATIASVVALNWTSMDDSVRNSVSMITTIVAGGLLALGAILSFSGANPVLGIALLAAGAATLAATAALNWDSMTGPLKTAITTVSAIAGAAVLVLGAILTFSGANPVLGIALLAAGAAGLITAAALNWDSIVSTVAKTLKEVGHIVGLSLIALGAILLLSGVGAPLGLGMLLVGGGSLATSVALNWDSIVTSVKTTLSKIGSGFMDFVDEWLSPSKWLELGKSAVSGLLDGLSSMVSGIASWAGGVWNSITGIFSGGTAAQASYSISTVPGRSIQQYATGGFPEYGQLFIANEDAPELVGNIGRQTAVANTQQIVQGIAAGVAEANMQQNALLREQNELLRQILAKEGATYLDGKILLRSVEKASKNTGVNIMSGGVV